MDVVKFPMFTEMVDKHLSTVHKVNKRKKNVFHPSFMHNACMRAIVYNYKGEGDFVVTDPKLKRIFANGDDVHDRVQTMLKGCKVLIKKEAPVKHKKYRISGSCDGILRRSNSNEKLALEIKSINTKGFEWALKTGPKPEHINQVRIYMWLLKIEKGILYYECKNDQRHAAWLVEQDENTINEVKKKIEDAIEYIEKNEIPDMCYNEILRECDWCNYQVICRKEGGTIRKIEPSKPIIQRKFKL